MNENNNKDMVAKVSVIIPTLNGAKQLRELLSSFTIQTLKPDEIIVIDSASKDNSAEVAEEYGAHVTSISRGEFDHGGTRSIGAQQAKNEILVYFTQDALPAHRQVIENLVFPLLSSDDIAISYGRQLPAFDANEISRHLRLFNYPDKSYKMNFDDRFRFGFKTIFASNSCSAYRKTMLTEIDFFKNNLIFGEDTYAAGYLLQKGYRLAYIAEAEVYHSHNYSLTEEFRRYFDIGVLHSVENWLLETYGAAESRGRDYIVSGMSHLYNRRKYSLIGDFMVRTALKYMGYQLGRHFRKIPGKVIPELSLNRGWWEKNSNC